MAIRANPKLIDELQKFGADDVSKCYHCGTCTATCQLTEGESIFPRREMRLLQMGLESKLEGSVDPWLCYYCGECSDECPREAEPGETMMSLRRWLTSRYDWTGISRLIYRSWVAELTIIILMAIVTGAFFLAMGFWKGDIHDYDGPDAFLQPGDTWFTVIPKFWTRGGLGIHLFDWLLAAVLVFFLGTNCIRMWWFSMGRNPDVRFSLWAYIKNIWLLPFHFFTQKRYAMCERKTPWAVHLWLMLSYVTMLILIMLFLDFMWSGPEIDWWVHAFGLTAAAGLLITSIVALRGRIVKTETHYEHSHESDWMFLILLLIVTCTGIAQFFLHRFGSDVAANIAYVIHLMAVVPMLGLEVPFSKWSHLAYRPLGMYFHNVREDSAPATQPVREPLGAAQAA